MISPTKFKPKKMIRVGRCTYNRQGKRHDPTYPNFESIVVLMNGHSQWGVLGPYSLTDDNGVILENLWQGSKCYSEVPKTTQRYSRWNQTVIWEWPKEKHCDGENILPAYWNWRDKLIHNKYAVRYPVGYGNMKNCLFALSDSDLNKKLGYIEARKAIYIPKYIELVRQQPKFHDLKQVLESGRNVLIIEVDGPHQESLNYYIDTYGVRESFIEQDSMLATDENLRIMMNDGKHPFGHGYCLAMALLNLDDLIN